MQEFHELKNAQHFLDTTYKDFENMNLREIKKNICDSLWVLNHFIQLNDPTTKERINERLVRNI